LDLSEVRRTSGQRHPWEIARVRALSTILRRRQVRIESILDVGCGDGFIGESLRNMLGARALVGIDAHLPDTECGILRAADHVIERYPSDRSIGDRRFDLVLALDVIEHVDDDRALVDDVVSHWTTPGGLVLVTVPAFQSLFSHHDLALRHHRRYNHAQLRTLLEGAGLAILEDGYLFASLVAPRALAVLGERLGFQQDDHGVGSWEGPPWLAQLIAATLTLDAEALLAATRLGIRVPGLTAWALCAAQ